MHNIPQQPVNGKFAIHPKGDSFLLVSAPAFPVPGYVPVSADEVSDAVWLFAEELASKMPGDDGHTVAYIFERVSASLIENALPEKIRLFLGSAIADGRLCVLVGGAA